MSLLCAYGQALRDVAKGRRVLLVNLDSPDAALSITVLKSILHESGCCSSIEATSSQCVARTRHGTLPQLASLLLNEYYKTHKPPANNAPTVEEYVARNPDTHEAESLACLLSDPSASYILEVFHSVHEPTSREEPPLLPPDCAHLTLTDGRGSYLGLLFAPASGQTTSGQTTAPASLADLQALKASAAGCLTTFREAHPGAAVVLAGVYHPAFKLNLLEDSQPEALTLIQALQQTHQQLHPSPSHAPPQPALPRGGSPPAMPSGRHPGCGSEASSAQTGSGHGPFPWQGGCGGDEGGKEGQGVRARHRPEVDFWVGVGAVAAVAVGGVAMLVRQVAKGSKQSDS